MSYSAGLGGYKLAGEDMDNDALNTQAVSIGQDAVGFQSITAGASAVSGVIDTSRFRKFRVAGYGETGTVQLKVEWSSDGGASGWWYVMESDSNQYPATIGDIVAPFIRVTVTNTSAATQNAKAVLAMQS